jgi:hypothetical protein
MAGCSKRSAYAIGRGRYDLSRAAITSRLLSEFMDDKLGLLDPTAFSVQHW